MDWAALRDAARRGMRPGKPLQEPRKLLRVAIGMLVAAIVGYLLHDPGEQLLVTVGAFLAAIAAVMPHNRSRIVATAVTCLAQIAAAALGVLLGGNWAVALPLVFVLFLVAGLLRAVALSLSIRMTVVTIVFLAFAEIAPASVGGAVGFFSLGFAIMFLAQLLPPYGSRHSSQRRAVAGLYLAIATGESEDSALLAAERSLALLRRRSHRELDRLAQLVERGEEIGQQMRALGNRTDAASARWRAAACDQLRAVASAISRPREGSSLAAASRPHQPGDGLELALSRAVDTATRLTAGGEVPPASDQRRAPSSLELLRDELRWGSPILHHAVRLAVVCVIAQVVGMAAGSWLGRDAFLAGHGFWVVVAAALIVFPDYGSTFSRGIGRTIGTVAGAAFGVALSFLPAIPVLHAAVLLLLFYGYLAFRSCGQPYTMFWVVAWIGSLTPGPLGATTRGLDTVIGCLLAFAAYLVAPTWQRRLLTERLTEWAEAAARQIDALVLLWTADDEPHRLAVAHSTVRARLTGLEFTAAARSARDEPRDRRGRWPNDTLALAIDAVTSVRRQIAALSALAPLWNDDERAAVCAQVEMHSRVLDAVAQAPEFSAPHSNTGGAQGPTVSADTAAALDLLRDAGAAVEKIAAAQSPVGAR
ncbi:FUSC family protein [Amycolatopsis halotolerans]|uniref:FUSC family protein n=1 Tax=Amycolatopsis halotolerans TaxID=330083 RepID=A0ABV7QYH7_9PSEU